MQSVMTAKKLGQVDDSIHSKWNHQPVSFDLGKS